MIAATHQLPLPVVVALAVLGCGLGPALASLSRPLHERWLGARDLVQRRSWWPPGRRGVAMGLGCGLLWLGVALRWGTSAGLVPLLFLSVVLVVMSAVDLKHQLIPDRLTVPATFVAFPALVIAAGAAGEPRRLLWAAVGAWGYGAVLYLAHVIYPDGMGFGDVKFAPLLGAYLGWSATGSVDAIQRVLGAVFLASFIGSLVGVAVWSRYNRQRHYPFGPWLAAGAMIVLLASPPA